MLADPRSARSRAAEEFVSGTNTANIKQVGDRLYEERLYKAAKILYQSIPDNAKLASCYVRLGEYTQAPKRCLLPRSASFARLASDMQEPVPGWRTSLTGSCCMTMCRQHLRV